MSDRGLLLRVHAEFEDVVALVDDAIVRLLHGEYDASSVSRLHKVLQAAIQNADEAESLSDVSSAAMLSGVFGTRHHEIDDIVSELDHLDKDSTVLVKNLNKLATILEGERVTIAHRIGRL
ncbi:MAG: hypothetical protein AAFU34_17005 [Pseudomonadota bacterium]